ncbi:MAG TPA: POTRA domain-containing protein, partial [Pyrinomonadaceae bacterium]|nr:POTRA domain-containing protein [Pyrinomonadaceae bacterium]
MSQKAEGKRQKAVSRGPKGKRLLFFCLLPVAFCLLLSSSAFAQVGDYEGRPVAAVEVVIEGTPADAAAQAEFKGILKIAVGDEYSAVNVRQSLHDLYASGRVASARVEISESGTGRLAPVSIRFVVQRQIIIAGVSIRGAFTGTPIARDEIRARLNLLESGRRFSLVAIERNADEIQTYLRDRGYYNATVEHEEIPESSDATGTRRRVIYTITPNQQAHVAGFNININGFDPNLVRASLKLQPNAPFTREILGEDLNRIKQALIVKGYMAPQLEDPDPKFDSATNAINIVLKGKVGPLVEISFSPNYNLKESKQQKLLPIKREGNLDASILDEGARRVRQQLQEQGYFFADVEPRCTVTPPVPTMTENGTKETCQNLNPAELDGYNIKVVYDVTLRRRLRLADIRITGTNKLTIEDILPQLKSKKVSAFAFLPFLGSYGRGYTSSALLEQDQRTIRALMKDFGYRKNVVKVLQGISPAGDNLIITFQVTEGPLTRIAEIDIKGEKVFSDDRLRQELSIVKDAPYSPSQVRADNDQLLNLYAREGFIEAEVRPSIDELPMKGGDEQVR